MENLADYDEFVDKWWCLGSGTYEPANHGGMPELGYLAVCIAGEAGEVAEKVKKAYRDHGGKTDPMAIGKELGDVLYYLTKMAHIHGMTLDDVARINKEKLRDRKERGKMHGEGDDR